MIPRYIEFSRSDPRQQCRGALLSMLFDGKSVTEVVVNDISALKGRENEVLFPSKTDFEVQSFTEQNFRQS